MKVLLISIAVVGFNLSVARACPNFSGTYRSKYGPTYSYYRIFQSKCSAVRYVFEIEGHPPDEYKVVLDGKLRPNVFDDWTKFFWAADSIAQERWSAAEGGSLVHGREIWSLESDSGNPALRVFTVNPENGDPIDPFADEIFIKIK